MSAQRTRSAVPADHRSAHPDIAGLPWWGAVLVALICSTLGFAFDAGSGGGNLTKVFGSLYVIGCLAAVLAVRRSGLFTAVVQPPLILFVVVPGAYFLMHASDIAGLKDLLINCGYPLIERFPLMFFTSAAVLLIGAGRWYLGRSDAAEAPDTAAPRPSVLATLTAMINSRLEPKEAAAEPRRRRAEDRSAPAKSARSRTERPSSRRAAAPSRSRPSRAADAEIADPGAPERPRRRRPPADTPPAERPRRRTRPAGERSRRSDVPPRDRERRRTERSGYRERPDTVGRDRQRDAQRPRPPRSESYDGYELFGGYEPSPRSRPRPDTDHHPVSRVRYRGSDDADGTDYQPRRRSARDADADRWKYDI
ncbi:DUF6542 domain-containing protein [Mycolicibacterium vaccae]|uniref:DUF6542 domain-containing protein n=1 Tax=Mycolicibacterium vaccae TaxID=1810 RepID=UPI003CEB7D59